MASKIILDRSGDLRQAAFYRFDVQYEDTPTIAPARGSVVMPRTPTNDELYLLGKETYRWVKLTGSTDSLIEIYECPLDKEHVTRSYFTKLRGIAYGGNRISPIIATNGSETFVLSDDLRHRVELLRLRGIRIDAISLTDGDVGPGLSGFWALQFIGEAKLRLPKFVGLANCCPHCGKGEVICKGCGAWHAYCTVCKKQMVITESMHKGDGDKRIPVEEDGIWRVLEGKHWDGSDLVQAKGAPFASKRFIDWLLRIHAAPFYAEPVEFCVDGMSDQQKKWFDDLQKPFEA